MFSLRVRVGLIGTREKLAKLLSSPRKLSEMPVMVEWKERRKFVRSRTIVVPLTVANVGTWRMRVGRSGEEASTMSVEESFAMGSDSALISSTMQ
jgi:hypothetical protein